MKLNFGFYFILFGGWRLLISGWCSLLIDIKYRIDWESSDIESRFKVIEITKGKYHIIIIIEEDDGKHDGSEQLFYIVFDGN